MLDLKKSSLVFLALRRCLLVSAPGAIAGSPDDSAALAGIKTGKALFDINLAEAAKLPLYPEVIKRIHAELKKQQVTPDFIAAFRGPAAPLGLLPDLSPKTGRLVQRLTICLAATSKVPTGPRNTSVTWPSSP